MDIANGLCLRLSTFSEMSLAFICQLFLVYSSGIVFLYIATTLPELSNT